MLIHRCLYLLLIINEFVGRIGVGKIENGKIKVNQEVAIVNHHDPSLRKRVRVTKLYVHSTDLIR